MTEQEMFQIDTQNLLTVAGTTDVLVRDAVKLVRGGETVACADALYDFSDVPERYHGELAALIPLPQVLLLPIVPSKMVWIDT